MQGHNLLEIDSDKLFETHTISEVQEIRKKLQAEVEKKKEDLRIIVGERYRDLIDAADTITEMKQTVAGVALHQDQMTVQLQHLQQRQLFGFRTPEKSSTSQRLAKNKFFCGVAVQVKILVDIPDQIWTAMEQGDFILGAQLFLLARHISMGLQLEGGEPEGSLVVERMPLIPQQWDTISQFRTAILQGCQESLQSHTLSPEEAASCLSAMVLLEGLNSLELLDRFLELRKSSLEKVLQFDSHASVKTSVSSALQLLIHTILLLHACFCDGSDDAQGLVWKKLKSIVGRDAPPSISLFDLKDFAVTRFLPPVVKEYRPSCGTGVQPVSPGDMRGRVTAWLDWVAGQVRHQAAALLGLVGTLRSLRGVREVAMAVSAGPDWKEACRRLMVPRGLDPWREYFAPLVTAHAKSLIVRKWTEAVAELEDMLVAAVRDATNERCNQPEHDLRWFLWKEWATDLPREQSTNHRGLLMKVMGCTPSVEKLCTALDTRLESLIKDLQFYLSPELQHEGTESSDNAELKQHLQQYSDTSIRRLVEFVESRFVSSANEASTVLSARFLQALTSLCPGLHKCLAPATFHREGPGAWQELCSWLRLRSLACWQVWSTLVQAQLRDAVATHLSDGPGSLLESAPRWQETSVQEELDEGCSVSSRIRVPAQPSLPLQAVLWQAAHRINLVGSHAVPRTVLQGLVTELLACLLAHYRTCLDTDHTGTQAQALQLLLDVRFLATLLLPRDNKELSSKSQEISEKLEEKIDPFDLNVFSPYLQANIKTSVQRNQSLLGVLVAWPEKMLPLPGPAHDGGSKGADPSVVPLCSGAPWFPLLPLAGPPTAHLPSLIPDKPQPKKVASSKSKVEASPGDIMRSSAAAFFGAMSSEWFGSS